MSDGGREAMTLQEWMDEVEKQLAELRGELAHLRGWMVTLNAFEGTDLEETIMTHLQPSEGSTEKGGRDGGQ